MESAVDTVATLLYLPSILLALGFLILTYVLEALAVQTIARRRGINHPWLAWLPIGGAWMWGCISDQYQYVVQGQIRNKRKALLVLSILQHVLELAVSFQATRAMGAVIGFALNPPMNMTEEQTLNLLLGPVLSMSGSILLDLCLSIPLTIIQYFCLYDIYRSCDPGSAVVFLILSIFLRVTEPFLLFALRNKDLGMPPRQDQIPPQPTWTPQPPTWESTRPPQGPWVP